METPTPVLSTCLICFETRALKIVGNCKHSFCTECLSTVLGNLESGSEVFGCPSCKVDCPLPWDGVNGMVDFTGDTVDATDTVREGMVAPAENETVRQGQEMLENATGDVICDLCDYKHKQVPAANICAACDNLSICKECSTAHGTKKATKNHILTPLRTKRQGKVPTCKMHHKLLIRFCLTCKEPVCKICVSLDHGDHDIETLADTIQSKVEEVRVILEAQAVKRNDLQQLQTELTLLNAKAPLVDKRDILIKDIEDHAQKCIDQIVTWKENLMKQVQVDYKLIQDIPVGLEKVSKMVQKLDRPINTATHLLTEIEEHPAYLDQLVSVQQEFQAIPQREDGTEEKEFQSRLLKLNSDNHFFSPDPVCHSYGKIEKTTQETTDFEPQELFQHKMQVDSEHKYIQCVAVLGPKYYAVAHPEKPDRLPKAIDIYEFPGTLKKTLRDHVQPLYDMSATPDGKLAVLSDGTSDRTYSVKLFDPETGYISSTQDIDITKALSLGVTLKHEYVILSGQSAEIPATDDNNEDNKGQISTVVNDGVAEIPVIDDDNGLITITGKDKVALASGDDQDNEGNEDDDDGNDENYSTLITIVDREGVVKHSHHLADQDIDDVTYCTSITCGGRFIFVKGYFNVAVYEIQDTVLKKITTCPPEGTVLGAVMDISATMWDNLFLTDITSEEGEESDNVYLTWLQDKENKLDWQESEYHIVHHKNVNKLGPDAQARVSTRDGHTVVMSHGTTIKVFKC